MKARHLATASLVSAAVALGAATPALAAGWDTPSPGYWSNNGCQFRALAWSDSSGAGGEVFEQYGPNDCSGGWVELHYTDAKGVDRVDSKVVGWTSPDGGGHATVFNKADATLRYACFSARSRSAGNWSVTHKLGTGSGGCGRP